MADEVEDFDCSILFSSLLVSKEELFENQCYRHALKSETSMPQTLKEMERWSVQLLIFNLASKVEDLRHLEFI